MAYYANFHCPAVAFRLYLLGFRFDFDIFVAFFFLIIFSFDFIDLVDFRTFFDDEGPSDAELGSTGKSIGNIVSSFNNSQNSSIVLPGQGLLMYRYMPRGQSSGRVMLNLYVFNVMSHILSSIVTTALSRSVTMTCVNFFS